MIGIAVTFSIFAFYYIYKKRKVLFSLGLTVFLGIMIVIAINTETLIFNNYSVNVEMC